MAPASEMCRPPSGQILEIKSVQGLTPAEGSGSALSFAPVKLALGAVDIPAQVAAFLVAQPLAGPLVSLGRRTLLSPFALHLPRRIASILLLKARPEIPWGSHCGLRQHRDCKSEHCHPHFHPLIPC